MRSKQGSSGGAAVKDSLLINTGIVLWLRFEIPCTDSSIIVTQEGDLCRAHCDAIIIHCLSQTMGMVQSSLSLSRDYALKENEKAYIYHVSCLPKCFSLFLSFHMESVYSPPANVALSTPARRRARTTRRQFQILERFFSEQTAYPDKKQKKQLAQLVGFTEESVHFW